MTLTKKQCQELIDELNEPVNCELREDGFPHYPIKIGDILSRMTKPVELTGYDIKERSENKYNLLLMHWNECGFTESLQEIYKMIEWEGEVAKPSRATELFTFLNNLEV